MNSSELTDEFARRLTEWDGGCGSGWGRGRLKEGQEEGRVFRAVLPEGKITYLLVPIDTIFLQRLVSY